MEGSSIQNVHGKGRIRPQNDQHHREEDEHTNRSCGNLCSPPEFDLSAFDDEVGNNSDSITKINNSTRSSSIPSHLSIRRQKFPLDKSKKKKHQDRDDRNRHDRRSSSDRIRSLENQKQSKWRDLKQGDISATKNRNRRHRDTNCKRGISSTQDSTKSKSQRLSQPTKSTTRSIVGLRPTHWVRDSKPVQQRNSNSTTRTNSFQRLAKSSALVAATRPNRRLKDAKSNRKNHVDNFGHGSILVNNARCHNSSPIEKNDATETPSTNKRPSSEPTKPSFSFAPSFVPTKVSALADDAIGDDSGDECRVVSTSRNNSFASTPPFKRRRRSKAATGEWVRRLACLRNMHNNDSARLQNKAFTRHRMLLDVNDPRKRAKTYTDVTILGQYLGPWINVPEDMRVTVLGYAHRHVLQIKNCTHNDRYNDRQEQTQKQEDTKTFSKDFFAWFTFTVATARRIELQQGCKLRIYNAIILPCRLPIAPDIPPTSSSLLDNKIGTNSVNRCDRTVICTHLCERVASFNEK